MAEKLHSDGIDIDDHSTPESLAVFDGYRFDWAVLTHIFSFLDLQSKGRVSQVSSTWCDVAYQQSLWYNVEVKLICGRDPDVGYVAILPPRLTKQEERRLSQDVIVGRHNPNLLPIATQGGKHHLTNFRFCGDITDVGIASACKYFKNMRSVTIPEGICEVTSFDGRGSPTLGVVSLTVAGAKLLASMKHLEKVVIGLLYQRLSDESMYYLAASASLRVLHLDGCHKIGDGGMKFLAERGSKITEFYTKFDRLTSDGWRYLPKLEHLKVLNLKTSSIDDAGIAHLAANMDSRITCLTLDCCSGITDNALVHLAKMKNLRELELIWCKVGDKGLAHLATGGSNIKKLMLHCHYENRGDTDEDDDDNDDNYKVNLYVTDRGFIHLAKLAQLQCLNVESFGVTCQGLVHLSEGAAKIVSLDVCGCDNVGGRTLLTISQHFPMMRVLYLSDHQITDQGLASAALKLLHLEFLVEVDFHFEVQSNVFHKILELRDAHRAVTE